MGFESTLVLLAGLFLVAALLYASVGHAGASGYLAVMALAGIAPATMKPTALALNIVVAAIATYRFGRAGAFSWGLFAPLALAAAPLAYLGGRLTLPADSYKLLVGTVLLYSAVRLLRAAKLADAYEVARPSLPVLVVAGAALGLLSGLTGVGGGIFLSPLLLFLHWAPVKVISGVAAAFILVNSIAGLMGVVASNPGGFHPALPLWAGAVVIGGLVGAEYGSRRLGNPTLVRLLAVVLAIAGIKMITRFSRSRTSSASAGFETSLKISPSSCASIRTPG